MFRRGVSATKKEEERTSCFLSEDHIRSRVESGDGGLASLHELLRLGAERLPLRVHSDSLRLGIPLHALVLLHTVQELLAALGVFHMLYPDMNPLRDDPIPDELVDLDTDRVRGHIPHTPGLSVVELVRHTLVHGTVRGDVHDLPDLVHMEEGLGLDRPCGGLRGGKREKEEEEEENIIIRRREGFRGWGGGREQTLLAELPREEMTSSSAVTKGVWHLLDFSVGEGRMEGRMGWMGKEEDENERRMSTGAEQEQQIRSARRWNGTKLNEREAEGRR